MNLWNKLARSVFRSTLESIDGESQRLAIEASHINAARRELSEVFAQESIPELEGTGVDEIGWRRLTTNGNAELSREQLRCVQTVSRIMFLKNPLVRRSVSLQAMYVWAQGVSITSKDEPTQKALDMIMQDRGNKRVLGHQGRMMAEMDLQVLGNLFFHFPTAGGKISIRSIPAIEVEDIVMNPDDGQEEWLFKRCWTQQEFSTTTGTRPGALREAYYPALHTSHELPVEQSGGPTVSAEPMYHIGVGRLSDMKQGVPETYPGLDWARAQTNFLNNWSKVVSAHAQFAWQVDVEKGGKKGVSEVKDRINTKIAPGTGGRDPNAPPVSGATWIGANMKLEPVRTAGATTKADDVRRLLLMYCAASGFAEHFFGDLSTGNLATAKTLDRPTELMIMDRQKLWREALYEILCYMLTAYGIGTAQIDDKPAERPDIEITFPPILEHDITETIGAIVSAATLDGDPMGPAIDLETTSRMLLKALGAEDIEAKIKLILADAENAKQEQADAIAAQNMRDNGVPPKVRESVRNMRLAVENFRDEYGAALEALKEKVAA